MYPPKIAGHVVLSYRSSLQNCYEDDMFEAAPNLRTLIGFDLPSFSLPKLRYLRVLHVEKSRVMNLSRAISGCIHLRCLRLIGCNKASFFTWAITLLENYRSKAYIFVIRSAKIHMGYPCSKACLL